MSDYYDDLTVRDMALTHAVALVSGNFPADQFPVSLVTDAADVFTAWLKGEKVDHDSDE